MRQWLFIVMVLVFSLSAYPFRTKEMKSALDAMTYIAPELRVSETGEDYEEIRETFATSNAVQQFLNANGGEWRAYIDLRRGVPSLLEGKGIPFLPGLSNNLSWNSFGADCSSIQCIPKEKVETLARNFLEQYQGLFPVRQDELVLDPDGTVPVWESIYLIRFQWVMDGIPVERASIYFIINNGGLIQISSKRIAPIYLNTTPTLTKQDAWLILDRYLGKNSVTNDDVIVDAGSLSIIPTTKKGMDTFKYSGTIGSMADYRLVYKIAFRRSGLDGTWEASIDAHSGELLRFVDINRYGRIHGGAKTSDGVPMDEDRPFPFADTGLASPNQYSDAQGNFSGDNATSTLTGKYCTIADACGSISNTTTTGDMDFITDPSDESVTDCSVPPGNTGGLGNTKSARTQFFNLTAINLKAQIYNPSNTWLTSSSITAETNDGTDCNAYSSGSLVHFYKRIAGSCNNLGEIPGVSMHEWSHSYDNYDGSGGDSPPLETYGDFAAIVQTHNSCTGAGFLIGVNCHGYGDACTDCTGVRDCDWAKHASNTPWTVSNNADNGGTVWDSCGTGSYQGPCGWEDHCESGISTQALWDFVYRDLPTYSGMDLTSAWMLEDRLWFTGVITLDDMYTCTGSSSSGCTGNTLYNVMRALDDDNSNLNDGTPHAQAIYQSLARHQIACGAAGDAANQNYSTCPSLTTPTLSTAGGNNSVTLTWTSGGSNATRYFVYRNESDCDVAFNRIAVVNAPTLTYVDDACVNGYTYYYRIQAATSNDACVSSSSNCATGIPVECTGSPILDSSLYNCSSTVIVSIGDSSAPSSPFTVDAWSTSDPTHRAVTVSGAGSPYTGSFTITSGAGGPGVVHVEHGNTLYVEYTDPDNCGSGTLAVQATALIDCSGPMISNVNAINISGTTADIVWDTNENSDSEVTYENATPPVSGYASDFALTTSHSVHLTGLSESTQYYFYVESTDPAANTAMDNNSGSYYTFKTVKNTQPTYTNTTQVPIPDSNTTGASSVISVPDDKVISDVNVTVNITHTYDGDLEIHLIAPDNTDIILSNNRGGSGDNFTDTVFDDEASTAIASGAAPFTGSFIPDQALSTFDTMSGLGDWTLKVIDSAGGDTGTIDSWSIEFTFPAGVCPDSNGWIQLDDVVYGCNSPMEITVQDADLLGTGTLGVEVFSDTESTPETVSLTENPASSGIFVGTFDTTNAAPAGGDGAVSISHGDTITARYIDADDGLGGTNVPKTDTASAECQPPVISNVLISNITGNSAEVTWDTDKNADSTVVYEDGMPPSASTEFDGTLVMSHSIVLTGLTSCTTYYLYVQSADVYGSTATDTNSGSYYSFTTIQNSNPTYASADVPKAISDYATVTSTIDVPDTKAIVDINVLINITHTFDGDLDIFLIAPDDTRVELTTDNGSGGDNFVDTIFDQEAATSITAGAAPFTGSFRPEGDLSTLYTKMANGTWTLEIYDDGSGDTGTLTGWSLIFTFPGAACGPHMTYSTHALVADTCTGTGGAVDGVWDAGERVQFSVTVENDGTVDLTNVTATVTAVTAGMSMVDGSASFGAIARGATGLSQGDHVMVQLPPGLSCGQMVDFSIEITSDLGTTWTDTFSQELGSYSGGTVPIWIDDFETDRGWTFSSAAGEWERGAPQGLGGSANGGSGNSDPSAAVSGTRVLGNDLSGQGSYSGNYEDSITTASTATSPAINCSGYSNVQLSFQRWLGVESSTFDHARVQVSNDGTNWTEVYGNPSSSFSDSSWGLFTYDISAVADDQAAVYVRFSISSDGSVRYCGWNIDDVTLLGDIPPVCNMNICTPGSSGPTPIPDGSGGSTAVIVTKANTTGSQLTVTWDDMCSPAEADLIMGPLSSIASYTVSGWQCTLDNPHTWDIGSTTNVWFVLVGEDGSGTESSWGTSASGQRNGTTMSGVCGHSARDNNGTCP